MPTKTVLWQITVAQCRWRKEAPNRRTIKHWTWSMYLIRIKRHTCLTSHASHLYYCLTRFFFILFLLLRPLFFAFWAFCLFYFICTVFTPFGWGNIVKWLASHVRVDQIKWHTSNHTFTMKLNKQTKELAPAKKREAHTQLKKISQWERHTHTLIYHLFVYRVPWNCLMLNNDKSQRKKTKSCEWMPCACSSDVAGMKFDWSVGMCSPSNNICNHTSVGGHFFIYCAIVELIRP